MRGSSFKQIKLSRSLENSYKEQKLSQCTGKQNYVTKNEKNWLLLLEQQKNLEWSSTVKSNKAYGARNFVAVIGLVGDEESST